MKKLFLIALLIALFPSVSFSQVHTYTENTAPTSDDIFYLENDPAGSPANNKISYGTIETKIQETIDTEAEFESELFAITTPAELSTGLETQDTCAEITGCVENAIVNGANTVSSSNINWSNIENINTDNINWLDFQVPLDNVNWDSLIIQDSNVNWDDVALPFESKVAFEDPTASDDFIFDEMSFDATASLIYCITSAGTVNLDVQIGGSDINGTDIACTTAGVLDDTLSGDTALNDGEALSLAITSVELDPTYLFLKVKGSHDR